MEPHQNPTTSTSSPVPQLWTNPPVDASRPSSSSTAFITAPSSNQSNTSALAVNVAPSTADSEESYLDSLDEARAPLLGPQIPTGVNGYPIEQELNSGDESTDDERPYLHPDPELGFGSTNTTVSPRQRTGSRLGSNNQEITTVTIKSPTQSRRRIPRDRYKAGLAILFLSFSAMSNDLILSYIHELVPETAPLPDFAFSHLPYWVWALPISEYLMLTSFFVLSLITFLHRHRWVLIRRIATIAALLYLGRCVTMFVTQVPKADPMYYCSPKFTPDERTVWKILLRGLRVLSGLGLSINGKHVLCGDYIYSGHTVVHVTCYLFIREYSPKSWKLLHYTSALFSTVGVFCLLFSRGHYSIDCIIAYWITTRVFWEYHTLANLPVLRSSQHGRNHMTKIIWFPLFKFMESNVMRPIPRRYALPRPLRCLLPRRLQARAAAQNDAHIR